MLDFAAQIIPPRMWKRIEAVVSPISRLAVERNPGLVDLDIRRRTIDRMSEHGYRQLLSVSLQGPEDPAVGAILPALCAAANSELAGISDRRRRGVLGGGGGSAAARAPARRRARGRPNRRAGNAGFPGLPGRRRRAARRPAGAGGARVRLQPRPGLPAPPGPGAGPRLPGR